MQFMVSDVRGNLCCPRATWMFYPPFTPLRSVAARTALTSLSRNRAGRCCSERVTCRLTCARKLWPGNGSPRWVANKHENLGISAAILCCGADPCCGGGVTFWRAEFRQRLGPRLVRDSHWFTVLQAVLSRPASTVLGNPVARAFGAAPLCRASGCLVDACCGTFYPAGDCRRAGRGLRCLEARAAECGLWRWSDCRHSIYGLHGVSCWPSFLTLPTGNRDCVAGVANRCRLNVSGWQRRA